MLLRQPETLAPPHRRPLQFGLLWQAAREMGRQRVALIATLCQTLTSASLVATLSSQQGIFAQRFDSVDNLPDVVCRHCAGVRSRGSYINTLTVRRLGMFRVVRATYVVQLGLTLVVLALVTLAPLPREVEFALHILWSIGIFAMMGLTMGNLNAMAMEKLGHIAGFAASVITAASTVLSVAAGRTGGSGL